MFNREMQKLGEERSVIRELFEYGNERKRLLGEENVFDFSLGNPSVPAPACVGGEIARLLAEVPPERLHGYTSAPGLPEARRAIADHLRAIGGRADPGLVYLTCGASASLTIALHALCNAGDEVIVIAPFFPEYRIFIEGAGAKLVSVKADETFHLDLQAIGRAINGRTKAVIVNSPNNPTGAVYGEEELSALASVLRAAGKVRGEPVYLLADEPYRELTYGSKAPCISALYEHTVVCYSFSKSLSLPGERIGYIAVSPSCAGAEALFAAVAGAGRRLGFVCAPALFQRVVMKCLGRTADLEAYRQNRDLLYGALTQYGYECVPPEGAFYLFVKSPQPDAKAFSERAKKYELLLVPSDSFGIGGYVRISYCVARETIERSLSAFQKLIGEYRG